MRSAYIREISADTDEIIDFRSTFETTLIQGSNRSNQYIAFYLTQLTSQTISSSTPLIKELLHWALVRPDKEFVVLLSSFTLFRAPPIHYLAKTLSEKRIGGKLP